MKTLYIVLMLSLVSVMPTWSQDSISEPLPSLLSLDRAQAIAMRNNPSLQAAQERVNQAQAAVLQARSEYFPSLDTSFLASFTDISDDDVKAGKLFDPGFDDTLENYQASLSASWLVFDGFGRKFRNAIARFGEQQSEASLIEAKRLILNAVSTAYYNVQLARENIAISEADIQFNDRQLQEAKLREEVGTGSLSDVLNFEVRIRAARTALLTDQNASRLAMIGLVELMGIPHQEVPESMEVAALHSEEDAELTVPKAAPLLEYASTHRPDLKEIEYLVEQAGAGVDVSKSAYYPVLFASASGDAQREQNGYFDSDNISGTVALQLQFNIFSGGRRRAQVAQSKSIEAELKREQYRRELAVTSDVESNLSRLQTAKDVLLLQRENTEYVEQNRDLVDKEYQAGQGSLVRLNQAQRDLTTQQGQLALARVALRQIWYDLKTATGESLEPIAH
jgi:outer membrane protein TolC